MIDARESVNIMDEHTFQALQSQPRLNKCNIHIFSCASPTPLPVIGKFNKSEAKLANATFYVLKGSRSILLNFNSASQLGLIHITNIVHSSLGLCTLTSINPN